MACKYDDFFIARVDNQSNIVLIFIKNCNENSLNYSTSDSSSSSSISSSVLNPTDLTNYKPKLTETIQQQLKFWIDSLGVQSAQAQNLKEPITCYTKFIQGSFRQNSPLKHKDSIYFLLQDQSKSNQSTNALCNTHSSMIPLIAVGFIRVGFRNLFLQNGEKLVNVNRCFSILDFFITHQRQGLGKLLIDWVVKDQSITVNNCAFDRPTPAMLSFLKKHFKLGNPQKQHNRFVIYDGFFA